MGSVYTHKQKVTTQLTSKRIQDFLGGPVVKKPPANAGDMSSIPGLGRFHMTQGN